MRLNEADDELFATSKCATKKRLGFEVENRMTFTAMLVLAILQANT